MSASSSNLKERVADIITCPVCLEDFKDPRSLPCLHTFCSQCIDSFTASHQSESSDLPCPVCREPFTLGDHGVADLPRNFFIVDLLDASNLGNNGRELTQCEVCSLDDESSPDSTRATVYCVECGQSLCERCSLPHKRWKDGGHRILPLEEVRSGGGLTRSTSSYCEKDPREMVKMYCTDCKVNICIVCYATEHHQHQCQKIDAVAEEFGRQLDADVERVSQRVSEIQSRLDQLELEKNKFIVHVDGIEKSVLEKGAEVKQLIDSQLKEILDELRTVKQKVTKDITSVRESLEMSLVAVQSFTTYSKELRNKGKPCDLSKSASDLHARALKLQDMTLVPVENCIPNVIFKPADVSKTSGLLGRVTNFVGELIVTKYSSAPRLKHVLLDGEPVWGVASLNDQLFVLRSRSSDQVEVYSVAGYSLQHHLQVPKLSGLADMVAGVRDCCLYLVDCVTDHVHRVPVDGGSPIHWPVNDTSWGISVTPSHDVLVTCDEACKLKLFSPVGNLLREIPLFPDVVNPCHAVERVDGTLVVCHGAKTETSRRVCLVAADGSPGVTFSSGHTMEPRHLTVDSDGFVFVADADGKVLMLSPGLACVWEVASPSNGLRWKPWRLCSDGRRLFVAENKLVDAKWMAGSVVVFEL